MAEVVCESGELCGQRGGEPGGGGRGVAAEEGLGPARDLPDSRGQYSTVQYSTVQYSTVQYSANLSDSGGQALEPGGDTRRLHAV